MATWTEQMGYPLLTVTKGDDGNSVSIAQRWFLADGSIAEGADAKTWFVPIFVAGNDGNIIELGELAKGETSKAFKLPAEVSKSEYVVVNAGQKTMVRVKYDEGIYPVMVAAAKAGKLSVEDR